MAHDRNHIAVMPASRIKKVTRGDGYCYDVEVPYETAEKVDGKIVRRRDFDREYHMEVPAENAAIGGSLGCVRIPQEKIRIKSWNRSDGKDFEEFDESPLMVEVYFIKDSERRKAEKKKSDFAMER